MLQQALPPALAHAAGPLRGLWHGEGDSHSMCKLGGDSGLCQSPGSPSHCQGCWGAAGRGWALTWVPAAWRCAARRCPCPRDLLPRGIHAPAVPGAAVTLQGPVPTILIALGYMPIAHGRGSRWHPPWVQPLVLAGGQTLSGLCRQQTPPPWAQGVPHSSPRPAWHPDLCSLHSRLQVLGDALPAQFGLPSWAGAAPLQPPWHPVAVSSVPTATVTPQTMVP